MSFLDKWQNEPDSKKRRLSFVLALLITVVIILIWLPFNLFMRSDDHSKVEKASPLESIGSIFGSFKDDVSNKIEEAKQILPSLSGSANSFQATTSYQVIGAVETEEVVATSTQLEN